MKHNIKELLDLSALQRLTDDLYASSGIPSAIISMDGEVLTRSGWQRICTEFHRVHPDMEKECTESDIATRKALVNGEPFVLYHCPRGLVDASAPLLIGDEHVANVFLGQVFTDLPTLETETSFREQARRFGLDEEDYISAFREVPVISEDQFRPMLRSIAEMTQLLADTAFARLKEREASEAVLMMKTRYDEIAERLPTGIYSFRVYPGGMFFIDYLSPQGGRLLGVDPNEVVRDPSAVYINFVQEDRENILSRVEEVAHSLTPFRWEGRVTRYGKEHWIRLDAEGRKQPDGSILWDGVITDITKTKEIELELAESEARYRDIIETSPLPLAIHQNGVFVYANPAVLRLFGATHKRDVIGKRVLDRVHPDFREVVLNRISTGLKTGQLQPSLEERLIKLDGSEIIAEVTSQPTTYEGRPANQVVLNDVTARKTAENALRESESRFQQLAEQSRTFPWEVDAKGLYTYMSPIALDVIGYQPEEVVGRLHFYDLHPKKGREEFKNATFKSFSAKRAFLDFENPIEAKDGSIIWVSTNGIPVLDSNEKLVGYRGADTDITEWKIAEDTIRNADRVRETILKTAMDGFSVTDLQGLLLEVNDALVQLSGYSREELLNMRVADLESTEYPNRLQDHLESIQSVGYKRVETGIRRKNGDLIDVEVSVQYQPFEEGRLVAFIRDITERKRARDAIRKSEDNFRQLVERSGEFFYRQDLNTGEFLYASPKIMDLIGITPEECKALGLEAQTARLHPNDTVALSTFAQDLIDADKLGISFIEREFRLQHRDGGYVWIRGNYALIRDENGAPKEVVGSLADISAHKSEEKLRDLSLEVLTLINQGTELKQVMQKLVYLLQDWTGCEAVAIRIKIGEEFPCIAAVGLPEGKFSPSDCSPKSIPSFPKVTIPINVNETKFGMIELCDRRNDRPSTSLVESLQQLAQNIAYSLAFQHSVEIISEKEKQYHDIFDHSPIAIWEEDFSEVMNRFKELRAAGVDDLDAYLGEHPEELVHLAMLVKVVEVNEASLQQLGASSIDQLRKDLPSYFDEDSLKVFQEEIVALESGALRFKSEIPIRGLRGERRHLDLSLVVTAGHEATLKRVLVSFTDITEQKHAADAIRESEAKYRQLFEFANEGIFVGQAGRIKLCNEKLKQILQYEGDEVHSLSISSIVHPDDVLIVEQNRDARRRGDYMPPFYDVRVKRRDGKYIWLRINAAVVQWEGAVASLTFALDIDEMKRNELARTETELRFSRLVNKAFDAIYLIRDSQYEYVNPAFCELTGYSAEEVTAPDFDYHTFLPAQSIELIEQRQEARRLGEEIPGMYVVQILNRAGELLDVEVSTVSLEGPPSPLVLGIMRDITVSKRAAEELAASEAKYRTIASNINDAIIHHDFAGNIVEVNEIAQKLTGYEWSELVGGNVSMFTHPDALERMRSVLAEVKANRNAQYEARVVKKGGESLRVHISSQVISSEGQGLIQSLGRDLTVSIQQRLLNEAKLRLLLYSREHSLDELLQNALDECEALTGSEIGFFHLVDEDQEHLTLTAWSSNTLEKLCTAEGKGSHYPISQAGVWIDAFHKKAPVIHNDYAALSHKKGLPDGHAFVSRELVVPILRDDRVVAIFGVGNKPVDYGERDIAMVEAFAEMAWDRAEMKAVDDARRESEARFEAMFQNSPLGISLTTFPNGIFINANPAFESMYGYRYTEIVGKSSAEVGVWAVPEHRERVLADLASGSLIKDFETIGVTKAGEKKHISFSCEKVQIGQEWYILGISLDISARKQAEEALAASELKYRRIIDELVDVYFRTDRTGVLQMVSPSATKLLGYTPEELIGTLATEYFTDPEERTKLLDTLSAEGKKVDFRVRLNHKDGWSILTSASCRYIIDAAGKLEGVDGIFRDLTEREAAENERNRLEAELHQAQKMESIGRLAGGVAHDFNNMLMAISGNVEMAIESTDPSNESYWMLKEIQKSAARSADITRQLLGFARKQTITPEIVNLNDHIENSLKMLRRLVGEAIEVRYKPGENLGFVLMDPSQIDQILMNLAVNSRDAIGGNGEIFIRTEARHWDAGETTDGMKMPTGDYVCLHFTDTGKGMTEEVIEHIFEPFFTTKPVGEGTGLGLSTVFGIIKQNAGYIFVTSRIGFGTTFTIYLVKAASDARVTRLAVKEVLPHGTETILVVEDEAALLKVGKAILVKLGYTVFTASRPEEAIAIFKENAAHIDLIITDVVMPTMNGLSLVETLREIKPNARAIFMSGYSGDVPELEGVIQSGAILLQKPYSSSVLAESVRKALL